MSADVESRPGSDAATILFQLWDEAPELLPLVPTEALRHAGAIRETGRFPVAPSARPFEERPWFRPSQHARAFYWQEPGKEGVLAFKGTEVLSRDFAEAARELGAGRTFANMNDFFIFLEAKLPIACTRAESLREARKALALYRAVYTTFKEPPWLPLPLLAAVWSEEAVARYREQVFPLLSANARDAVGPHLAEGLGTYVYYFPKSPHRVRHAPPLANTAAELMAVLPRHRETVKSWVRLFVQILCAGYFPATLQDQQTGCCIQDQNVCVDGGFVDVGAVQAMSDVTDDLLFAANLTASIQMLTHSIAVSMKSITKLDRLFDGRILKMANYFGDKLNGGMFLPQVWREVQSAYSQLSPGLAVDPRLEALLGRLDGYDALVALLVGRFDRAAR